MNVQVLPFISSARIKEEKLYNMKDSDYLEIRKFKDGSLQYYYMPFLLFIFRTKSSLPVLKCKCGFTFRLSLPIITLAGL
jgi:hypothetical protein